MTIYLLFWLLLMVLAVANGVMRQVVYGPGLPELYAHQLSTFLAAVIFAAAVWLLAKKRPPASPEQALQIGVVWLALTLSFEFVFGHYVAGHSWARLLADYDLLSGRLWPLLLVWITFLPLLAYRVVGQGNSR
ncbi:hypothetical protein DWB85_15725 [Seongchinamella sediminis]|uniref:Uncharacterized protein n=2 Tax=Seongchinamella sediminis TaxID=2283635 RepID=A0A3L7DX68_9GAMM|nr:hypothetical protein DWB85_15725 [Seongchinamella sediminis]